MGANSVKYFLQGSNAAILYDPVANVVTAQSIDGIFCVKNKDAVAALRALDYKEVTKAQLEDLGFDIPKEADRTDYTVRDSKRYTMF